MLSASEQFISQCFIPCGVSFSAGKPHDVAEEEGRVLAGAEVAEGEKGGGAGGASQRAATAGHPTAAGGMEEGEQVLYPGWFCSGWVSCWSGWVCVAGLGGCDCLVAWVRLPLSWWPGGVGDCLIGPGGWVTILLAIKCGGWLTCWPSCVVGDCLAGHPVWWVTDLLAIKCGGWLTCWPSCVVGDCLAGHPVWWVTVLLAILCGGWLSCWPSCVVVTDLLAILCGGWPAGHPVWWVTVLLAILCGGWLSCWPFCVVGDLLAILCGGLLCCLPGGWVTVLLAIRCDGWLSCWWLVTNSPGWMGDCWWPPPGWTGDCHGGTNSWTSGLGPQHQLTLSDHGLVWFQLKLSQRALWWHRDTDKFNHQQVWGDLQSVDWNCCGRPNGMLRTAWKTNMYQVSQDNHPAKKSYVGQWNDGGSSQSWWPWST